MEDTFSYMKRNRTTSGFMAFKDRLREKEKKYKKLLFPDSPEQKDGPVKIVKTFKKRKEKGNG